MRRQGLQGLQARIVFVVGLGVIGPMALMAWTSWASLSGLSRELLAERQALAGNLADHAAYVVRADLEVLQAISLHPPAVPSTDAAGQQRLALHDALLRARLLERILLVSDGGAVVRAEPSRPGEAGPPVARLAGVDEAFRGRPVVTDVVETVPGVRRIHLLVPLRDWDGSVTGVALGIANPESHAFTALLKGVRPGDGASLDLLDGQGVVLASTDPDRRYHRTAPGEIVARAPLPAMPWSVAVRQQDTDASRTIAAFRRRLLVVSPVILALALLFAWGAGWSITRPVGILTAAAEQIAAGDMTRAIPPVGEDEVGRLGRSLERMRETLRRSHEELERRVQERTAALQEMTRKLSERERWRAQLLRKVISAQEDERKRLARELHDETSQSLAAVTMRIDAALASLPPGPARERLEEANAVGVRALDELHRLMVDLRPSVLDDLGLASAIRWAAKRHLEPLGVTARCEFSGLDDRRLPAEVETALFRIAQEALVNVARHAEADAVLVQCTAGEGEVTIEIEDDGKGFDPDILSAAPDAGAALGLMGMQERVELLGGTIEIDSAPGQGTRVALRVPIPATTGEGNG